MRVGIVGAGRQGRRRADVLHRDPKSELTVVADVDAQSAQRLAKDFGAEALNDWQALVNRPDVDAVVISTPPSLHSQIALAATRGGKHVLIEKPLAVTVEEGQEMVDAARQHSAVIKCGFNLRYHPGIAQAHRMMSEGRIGAVMFMRCRYGIQGFPAFENDWRANPTIAGGGEFLDRGVHVVDLFRWFAGEVQEIIGANDNFARRFHASQEDNAFALVRMEKGPIGQFHVSSTQWRNLFSLEVYGTDGYVSVEGLGGPYGTETLRFGKREEIPGPIAEEVVEFVGPDNSWAHEWKDFVNAVETGAEPLGNGFDGLQSLRLVRAFEESVRVGAPVRLAHPGAASEVA